MPFKGKFYYTKELQELLKVSRQRVLQIAKDRDWLPFAPGVYMGEEVEPYLQDRGIDTRYFSVFSWDYPEGITPEQESTLYDEVWRGIDSNDKD